MSGARLYDRRFSIVVADQKGQGLELGGLRCRFQVRQFEGPTPNSIYLEITNLSAATASRMKTEFTRVQISAGYEGRYGVIFDGTIIQSRYGRNSPTDTYCGIVATDGDTAHNYAVVNKTLAAGSKPEDAHREALTAMDPFGVTKGYTDPKMTGDALPRGKVLFGMARDVLHKVSKTTDTQWSIQNGRVVVTSRDGYLPNEVIVLNAKTGVIGLPHSAPDGIYVRCLLDPLLKIGQRVKLDNKSIQLLRTPVEPRAQQQFETLTQPKIENDGIYKIMAADHTGDTRGNDWYSDLACAAASVGTTPVAAQRMRFAPTFDLVPLPPSEVGGRRDKG